MFLLILHLFLYCLSSTFTGHILVKTMGIAVVCIFKFSVYIICMLYLLLFIMQTALLIKTPTEYYYLLK